MARAAGTSTGAPGATNAFCISMTSSALFFGSSLSKRCSRPRRASTRSMISRRISAEAIEVRGHPLSLILGGERTLAGAEVVLHVLRVAGARNRASYRRMRHDPLEEVLRPARDAELRRPRRKRFVPGFSKKSTFGEGAVGDHGHLSFPG